jgi:excisionase family DNA binding protein
MSDSSSFVNTRVPMLEDKYLTPSSAARRLCVGLDYFYKLLWTGKLSATKVNGRWRIPQAAIEQRLKEREARNG